MFIQYKSDLNNQTVKLDEYQQRAVVQIEKYQLLTERAAAEREELQIINRTAQVNKFVAALARFVTACSGTCRATSNGNRAVGRAKS